MLDGWRKFLWNFLMILKFFGPLDHFFRKLRFQILIAIVQNLIILFNFINMIEHEVKINNITNTCRPLITTQFQLLKKSSDQFPTCIELPYNYLLSDIRNLQTYLCSSARIIGVDFFEKPKNLPKLNYKNILVNNSGQKGEKIQFKPIKKYEKFHWTVDLITVYPELSHQPKQQLQRYFQKNIHILNQSSQLAISPLISLQKLKKSRIQCTIKRQKSKKKQKLFICRIPITIVLPILQQYETKNILNLICQDISKAVQIMVSNSLMWRVISFHNDILPIQNFYQSQESQKQKKDKVFQKFSIEQIAQTNLQKERKIVESRNILQNQKLKSRNVQMEKLEFSNGDDQKKTIISKKTSQINYSRNLMQTTGLLLLLLLIIGFYAYIKLF